MRISLEIVRVGQVLERLGQQFVFRVAEDATEGAVNLQEASFWGDQRHADRGTVEGASESLLALTKRTVRAFGRLSSCAELTLGAFALGHIPGNRRRGYNISRRVENRRGSKRNVDPAAILGQSRRLVRLNALSAAYSLQQTNHVVRQLRGREHCHGPPNRLVRAVAIDLLGRGIPVGDRPVKRRADDRFGTRRDDREQPRTGFLGGGPVTSTPQEEGVCGARGR